MNLGKRMMLTGVLSGAALLANMAFSDLDHAYPDPIIQTAVKTYGTGANAKQEETYRYAFQDGVHAVKYLSSKLNPYPFDEAGRPYTTTTQFSPQSDPDHAQYTLKEPIPPEGTTFNVINRKVIIPRSGQMLFEERVRWDTGAERTYKGAVPVKLSDFLRTYTSARGALDRLDVKLSEGYIANRVYSYPGDRITRLVEHLQHTANLGQLIFPAKIEKMPNYHVAAELDKQIAPLITLDKIIQAAYAGRKTPVERVSEEQLQKMVSDHDDRLINHAIGDILQTFIADFRERNLTQGVISTWQSSTYLIFKNWNWNIKNHREEYKVDISYLDFLSLLDQPSRESLSKTSLEAARSIAISRRINARRESGSRWLVESAVALRKSFFSDSSILEEYLVDGEPIIAVAPLKWPLTPHVIEHYSGVLKDHNGYSIYIPEIRERIVTNTIARLGEAALNGNLSSALKLVRPMIAEAEKHPVLESDLAQRSVPASAFAPLRVPDTIRPGWREITQTAIDRAKGEFKARWREIIEKGRRM